MGYRFPSEEHLMALMEVLNNDERYAEVAKKWEGDILVLVEPDETSGEDAQPMQMYLDLWHGKCRDAYVVEPTSDKNPEVTFRLSAPRANFLKIFTGELDPIQAMMTRRLVVRGNMAYMLRNIPVVLDFIRCIRKIEIDLGL